MIASPSDISAERSIVRQVLSEWNVVDANVRRQLLLLIDCEIHSVPEMSERPQALSARPFVSKDASYECRGPQPNNRQEFRNALAF